MTSFFRRHSFKVRVQSGSTIRGSFSLVPKIDARPFIDSYRTHWHFDDIIVSLVLATSWHREEFPGVPKRILGYDLISGLGFNFSFPFRVVPRIFPHSILYFLEGHRQLPRATGSPLRPVYGTVYRSLQSTWDRHLRLLHRTPNTRARPVVCSRRDEGPSSGKEFEFLLSGEG